MLIARSRVRRNILVSAFRVAVALGVALAFLVPAARLVRSSSGGLAYPVPLDDVYIYFDFARSTARGCFLCWTEDTGLSSGATSPPYALVLALGWAAGFRGQALGVFATLVAVLSLADLFASLERIAPKPGWLVLLAPLVLVGVPLLDWSWTSGMETAFFGAVLGRALASVGGACKAPPHVRPRAQLRAGLWLWLLAWTRPECMPLALGLGVVVGHGAGTTSLAGALARAQGPLLCGAAGWALLLRATTGEWAAAGAIRKLVTSDPYASTLDMAGTWLRNLLRVGTEGVEIALGGSLPTAVFGGVAAASLLSRETRRLGAALLWGAATSLALVCLNTTAPFQNLRYVAPTLVCVLVASVLGVASLCRLSRAAGGIAAAALAVSIAAATRTMPFQLDHFARSSRNIAEQQVEVGERLRDLGARRIFVGDAGAIPYVSDLPALDGLGLGGYRDSPFARASVHGVPAVIELIERLPASERPDVLAIYDSWWPGLGERFGERLFSVKISDNVICGGDEKVVYRADWSLLEDGATEPGALDTLDVADLVDEKYHSVIFTRPKGGFVIDAVHTRADGRRTWDAGRQLAAGQEISFALRVRAPAPQASLRIRTDAAGAGRVEHGDRSAELVPTSPQGDRWLELAVPLEDLHPEDRLQVVAGPTGLRVFSISIAD